MDFIPGRFRNYVISFFLIVIWSNISICAQERVTDRLFSMLVIENYNKTSLTTPYAGNAYYFDFFEINNEFAAYTDAKGILVSLGPDYRIALNSLVFLPENMRKSRRSEKWEKYVEISDENRRAEHPAFDKSTDIEPTVVVLLNAFRRIETIGPLNPENYRSFNWDALVLSETTNEIKFISKRRRTGFFEGSVFFNKKTNIIDSIHLTSTVWYSRLHNGIVEGWLRVYFTETPEGKTLLRQITGGFKKEEVMLLAGIIMLNNDFREIVLGNHESSDLIAYSQYPVVNYNGKEWSDYKEILDRIKGTCATKLPDMHRLSKEFEYHNGKPYRDVIHHGISTVDRYKDLYLRIDTILKNIFLNN